jgi:hypothetical protein
MRGFVLRLIHAEEGASPLASEGADAAALAEAILKRRIVIGNYLQWFDAEMHDGRGEAQFTPDLAKAKLFKDFDEAMEFWRTRSKTRPYRDDGAPNRPLTAFNITVEAVP